MLRLEKSQEVNKVMHVELEKIRKRNEALKDKSKQEKGKIMKDLIINEEKEWLDKKN